MHENVFEKVFEVTEIAKFSKEEYISYEDSLKDYCDLKNSLDTAKLEAKSEVVLNSIEIGFDMKTIAKITGLTIEQIEEIVK